MNVLYDLSIMKIGCPILQAALGGSREIANLFPAEYWFIEPTAQMRLYPIRTNKEVKALLKKTKDHHDRTREKQVNR